MKSSNAITRYQPRMGWAARVPFLGFYRAVCTPVALASERLDHDEAHPGPGEACA